MDYEIVYDNFMNKGCKLITNKEEFFDLKNKCKIPKLNYIASCGHSNSVHYNVFKSRNTGVICPKCIINKNKRCSGKITFSGQSINHYYHDIAITYIVDLIKDNYTYKYTHEGNTFDLLIKPIEELSDLWLQLKIKTTNVICKNSYGFNNDKSGNYKDCILICICNNDKKMWLFDDNDINNITKISIGKYKSKYTENEININNINNTIFNKYNTINLISSSSENTQLPKCVKIEKEYSELRKKFTKYEFTSVYKYLHTDFKLNNKNFQEKVGSIYKNKSSVNFKLTKRDSVSKSTQPYDNCDNDFYWLHFPNKKHFYLIPEFILIDKDENKIKKNLYVNVFPDGTPKINKLNYYLFEYENIDYNRFDSIIQFNHVEQ
jgi:hypothetical protein